MFRDSLSLKWAMRKDLPAIALVEENFCEGIEPAWSFKRFEEECCCRRTLTKIIVDDEKNGKVVAYIMYSSSEDCSVIQIDRIAFSADVEQQYAISIFLRPFEQKDCIKEIFLEIRESRLSTLKAFRACNFTANPAETLTDDCINVGEELFVLRKFLVQPHGYSLQPQLHAKR